MAENRYKVKSLHRYNVDDPNVCLDENYLPTVEIEPLKQQGWRALNVANGYGRFLRQKKAGKVSVLREGESASVFEQDDDPFADLTL